MPFTWEITKARKVGVALTYSYPLMNGICYAAGINLDNSLGTRHGIVATVVSDAIDFAG